jgi:hypothetical protein
MKRNLKSKQKSLRKIRTLSLELQNEETNEKEKYRMYNECDLHFLDHPIMNVQLKELVTTNILFKFPLFFFYFILSCALNLVHSFFIFSLSHVIMTVKLMMSRFMTRSITWNPLYMMASRSS